MMRLLSVAVAVVLATVSVAAHPHHKTRSLEEIAQSRLFHENAHRSLAACSNHDAVRELNEKIATQRLATITALRAERQRRKLAVNTILNTNHRSNLTDISPATVNTSTLFGTSNKCLLEPETTEGPYYVAGELIRKDIRENQAGIDLYTELQFIDVNTCQPVQQYYIDFWHCNSTGIYSGVVARSNGNANDQSNIDTTFHRGLYPTDTDGVVKFVTKFPGWYTGRATHIHILASHQGSVVNNTYAGGSVSSVGQVYFDEALLSEVASNPLYSINRQRATRNSADSIFRQSAGTDFDPVLNYVHLGDTVADGIYSWISVGIDTSQVRRVTAAVTREGNSTPAAVPSVGGAAPIVGGSPQPIASAAVMPAFAISACIAWVAASVLI